MKEILSTAERMLEEGADFLDVGGYSSRPGATDISVEEELKRTSIAIQAIVREFPDSLLSIDTFRSRVAKSAVDHGATIINDISGGNLDEDMLPTVAKVGVPYIAMHMRGTPQTMKELTEYNSLLKDVVQYFSEIDLKCRQLGIRDLIIDPGFGFAKTSEQSLHLLKHLDHFQVLERPILAGLSRKSMIYRSLNLTANEALNGTTTLNTVALFKGVGIVRVHDIREAAEAVKLVSKLS